MRETPHSELRINDFFLERGKKKRIKKKRKKKEKRHHKFLPLNTTKTKRRK